MLLNAAPCSYRSEKVDAALEKAVTSRRSAGVLMEATHASIGSSTPAARREYDDAMGALKRAVLLLQEHPSGARLRDAVTGVRGLDLPGACRSIAICVRTEYEVLRMETGREVPSLTDWNSKDDIDDGAAGIGWRSVVPKVVAAALVLAATVYVIFG